MKRQEIVALTQLRAVAAAIVFLVHLAVFPGFEWIKTTWFAGAGNLGVSIFFVLSGYVLAYNYESRPLLGTQGRMAFIVDRIAKIGPTHWLTMVLSIPLAILSKKASLLGFTYVSLNAALLQCWWPDMVGFNGPAWSLSCELFFYVAFAFLFPVCARSKRHIYIYILTATAITGYAAMLAAAASGVGTFDAHFLWKTFPPSRLAEFAIGVAICLGRDSIFRLKHYRSMAGFGAILCVGSLAVGDSLPEAWWTALRFVPGAICLVWGMAKWEGGLLNGKAGEMLRTLGLASFAFYMLHQIILHYIKGAMIYFPSLEAWSSWWLVAVLFLGIQGCSIWWFNRLEVPAQNWLRARNPWRRKVIAAAMLVS